MIRNLMALVSELWQAASVALCPCGEHVPTARPALDADPCTGDAPMCSGSSCAGCAL